MAKKITLRNSTSTNSGKEAKMSHAEMDANLETFFISSSLDGTTLYLHSTGSANVDSIDLSGLGGSGAQGIQGIQGTTGTGTQGIQGTTGTGAQGLQGLQGPSGGAGSTPTLDQVTTAGNSTSNNIFVGTVDAYNGKFQGQVTASTIGVNSDNSNARFEVQGDSWMEGRLWLPALKSLTTNLSILAVQTGSLGTFGEVTSIPLASAQGTQGIQGISGGASAQGTQGTQGLEGTGVQGIQGISGGASAQGIQGTQGLQGESIQGTQGLQGIQGIQGTQGIQGESIQGIQGTQGLQGIQGIQSAQGLQGTQGIQGQGITSTSLTLGSSSEPLGDHTDGSKHTVQTGWTRLSPSGASFTNASGGTKSYLVVFGLETSSTYSSSSPAPFNIDVRIADANAGAVVYTEWRDTVLLYRMPSEAQSRMTKTYVSHVYNLGDGDDFAIWVRGDSNVLGTLYVEYSLLTVTELTGLVVGTLN